MINYPFISIIIPTYKDWDRLKLCLDGFKTQTYPQDKFEVYVVNNDADDSFNNRFPIEENITMLDEAKPGSYAARNKALQYVKGEYIGFTDSDCIPQNDWIETAVTYFLADSGIDRIAGKMQMFYPNKNISLADKYDAVFAFPQDFYVHDGFGITGNLFVRKDVFNVVGIFDETLMSGGDKKWGETAYKKGFTIKYCSDLIVNHPTRSSFKELKKKAIRTGTGLRDFQGAKMGLGGRMYIVFRQYLPNAVHRIRYKKTGINIFDATKLVLLRGYLMFLRDKARYSND